MASGSMKAGWSVAEISDYQQTENEVSSSPSQQDGECQVYNASSLSIDSGTSSAEFSQLISDNESRFILTAFTFLTKFILCVHFEGIKCWIDYRIKVLLHCSL